MNCKHTSQFEDFELLLALNGDADPIIRTHVAQCPVCTARATHLKALEQRATALLFRADCPPALDLAEYQAGLAASDYSRVLQSHLANCSHCRAELVQIEAILAQPDPYLQPAEPLAGLKQQLARLTARLTGGGAGVPAPVGLRGQDDAPLIYNAGDTDLILSIHSDAAHTGYRTLTGLVLGLPDSDTATQISLLQQGAETSRTTLDSSGNFMLEHLLPGSYSLLLENTACTITILDLTI